MAVDVDDEAGGVADEAGAGDELGRLRGGRGGGGGVAVERERTRI